MDIKKAAQDGAAVPDAFRPSVKVIAGLDTRFTEINDDGAKREKAWMQVGSNPGSAPNNIECRNQPEFRFSLYLGETRADPNPPLEGI